MNFDRLQVNPELRNKWQAIDMGIALARQWYWPLLLAWVIPVLIVSIPFAIIDSTFITLLPLIIWWLKPLFERLPLLYLSRYLFGEFARPKMTLKGWFRLYTFDAFAALTWRRLSVCRSFTLAITVLEKQKGHARAERRRLLGRSTNRAATWLTITLIHAEMFLLFGCVSLVVLFIPEQVDINYDTLWSIIENPTVIEYVYTFLYFISIAIITPFYVACGFYLYINRRIELEAWDIEIQFKQCAESRLQNARKQQNREKQKRHLPDLTKVRSIITAIIPTLGTMLIGGLLLLPAAAIAEEPTPKYALLQESSDSSTTSSTTSRKTLSTPDAQIPPPEESQTLWRSDADATLDTKERILSILESPPFVIEKEVHHWKPKTSNGIVKTIREKIISAILSLLSLLGAPSNRIDIALFVEILLWGLVIAIIGLILWHFRHHFEGLIAPKSKSLSPLESDIPDTIMGMKVTQESLPTDVIGTIQSLLSTNQLKEALSLLYRANLHDLAHRHHVSLKSWCTEMECAQLAQASCPAPIASYFTALTHCWLQLAYGHHLPDKSKILSLANDWSNLQHSPPQVLDHGASQ
ncbi:DUF4129 domain-containing protein [Marinibactrum halimedae]|uniref:Protein-glutamine gamma-glutamyltransferase-like C-terminal domain-containing protein n=1 Tax=Marinibactrum halimedae TaxID=1444977 RepID=A0AA37TDS9_9GAMM|nr:DUF4129 domain-containing protein [Marinibactrum halimedae]MCD9460981.1 DUF4129 domain-containing protein [Marinibactrum halimedae]GLS28075.1 hypothetical protein GCM10007877_37940 [Marinibactrum halimedae]